MGRWPSSSSLLANCSSHFRLLCFTTIMKPYFFVWETDFLKKTYVHNDIKTILLLRYRKIDDTVTSLMLNEAQ